MPAASLVLAAIVATTGQVGGQVRGAPAFLDVDQPPGVLGGVHPTQVVVQLEPGEAFAIPGVLLRPAQPEATPIGRAILALEREGMTHIRPLFGELANEALAHELGLDRFYVVEVATHPRDAAARLRTIDDDAIAHAEANTMGGLLYTPNDTDFSNQYGLHNTGQSIPATLLDPGGPGTPDADIDAPEAWDLAQGSATVTIAVIDTGVSASHPEFATRRLAGQNFDPSSTDTDDSFIISHGTHVAGIAAAIGDNSMGVAGVAYGCTILPVKVLDLIGSGTAAVGAQGVTYAADFGADVINLSLGYEGESAALEAAIQYAHASGVVIVAAAGNDPLPAVPIPAKYPEVIAVGATDHFDNLADFSTEGPEVDVSAPGYNVWSTWDDFLAPDSYAAQSGTSMSAPHVAGLAALMKSANPALTNTEIRAIIESTVEDLGPPGHDHGFGLGRINAHAAVVAALATGACSPADVTTDGTSNGEPDGAVTLSDFSFYLNLWAALDPAADLTTDGTSNGVPDGAVTLSDFSYYLSLWAAGCP